VWIGEFIQTMDDELNLSEREIVRKALTLGYNVSGYFREDGMVFWVSDTTPRCVHPDIRYDLFPPLIGIIKGIHGFTLRTVTGIRFSVDPIGSWELHRIPMNELYAEPILEWNRIR
jgi:hypothetical protein